MLKAAWQHREFVRSSVRNEFASRFVRSRFGAIWLIIHPLAQVAIFAFVLSEVLSARISGLESAYGYALYLMAGMLAWALFSEVIGRSVTLFIDHSRLLKQIMFPRINLALITCGSALVTNALLFVAVLIIFALLGHSPGVQLLWLPLLIALNLGFALGLGLVLGVLNVFIRDVGQVVPILLQFAFWLTPIVYTPDILPAKYQGWLALNPLLPIVDGYQRVLVYNEPPAPQALAVSAIVAAISMFIALVLFRRANGEMVDAL